jgi:hypothetical protein
MYEERNKRQTDMRQEETHSEGATTYLPNRGTVLFQWGKLWKQLNDELVYLLTERVMLLYALHTVWISERYGQGSSLDYH